MSKKQKKMLTRILAAAVLLVVVKLLPEIRLPIHLPLISSPAAQNGTMFSLAPWLLYLVPYLIIGWECWPGPCATLPTARSLTRIS